MNIFGCICQVVVSLNIAPLSRKYASARGEKRENKPRESKRVLCKGCLREGSHNSASSFPESIEKRRPAQMTWISERERGNH